MDTPAATTASLAVVTLAAYAARTFGLRPADQRRKVLSAGSMQVEQRGDGDAILRPGASSLAFVGKYLDRRGYANKWRKDIERAGLTLRPGEYFLFRAFLGIVLFILPVVLLRGLPGLLLGIVLGFAGYMIPAVWVGMRGRSRINKIDRQLGEAITLIANAQRPGFAFAQGVDVAAQRMGPPISVELSRMMLDMNMGASTEDALVAMNERIGSEDLDLVVTAILIQRQTGGNLTEVLDNVTEIMRDRERSQGEIKSKTASQRMSGLILSAWPAALGLLFFAINPSMMSLMWTTTPGVVLLVIWLTLNLLGFFTMRRVLAIDI
jgi:tight adherence protein B